MSNPAPTGLVLLDFYLHFNNSFHLFKDGDVHHVLARHSHQV